MAPSRVSISLGLQVEWRDGSSAGLHFTTIFD